MRNWSCVGGLTCAVALSLGACFNFNAPTDSVASVGGSGAGSADGKAGTPISGGKSDVETDPHPGGDAPGGDAPGGDAPGGNASGGNASGGAGDAAGGSGGDSDVWGLGDGGTFGTNEPTVLTPCPLGYKIDVSAVATLAVSKTWNDAGVQLYGWDSKSSGGIVRWSDSLEPTKWSLWYCADNLPNVTHMAAMNLPGNADAPAQPEVLAAGDRFLAIRRGLLSGNQLGWTVWLPFSLPTTSTQISDVVALGATPTNRRPRVFIVDRGRVFVRTKIADDTYSDYGPWAAMRENGALLVSAAERQDNAQQVVTIGSSGQVQTALRAANAEKFGDWQDLAPFPGEAVDLESASAGAEGLRILVLDPSGTVWSMASDEKGATFNSLVSSAGPTKIVAIAARSSSGEPQLFGVDIGGQTYQLVGEAWSAATLWQ